MIDLREHNRIDISEAIPLKDGVAYRYIEELTGKNLVVKIIDLHDKNDQYLIAEFKKLFLLSAEPEIGTVYFLASCFDGYTEKSCYVMDYIQGHSISEVLEDNESLSYEFVIDVITQLASGLEKAHNYEVTHGDLNDGNIIIDIFGYLKIIDFDCFAATKSNKRIEDIESFNSIVDTLFAKCKGHNNSISILSNLFKSITTFKGLSKQILLLEEVLFDYEMLDEDGKLIISSIISEIPDSITLSQVLLLADVDIPEHLIPNITEKEKEYAAKENAGKLKFSDQRLARLQNNVVNIVDGKLHQLKQANLINWTWWISNTGKKFYGPYKFNIEIAVTPKLIKWKRTDKLIKFLKQIQSKELWELIPEYK